MFEEISAPEALSTHVFLDIDTEVIAVASKSTLGDPQLVGRRFLKLLMAVPQSQELRAKLSLDPIRDPGILLRSVEGAYEITRLWIILPPKNAFNNKEKLFTPVQDEASAIGADCSRLEFIGNHIDPEKIDDIIKEVAGMGGNAGASIRPEARQPIVRQSLNDEEVKVGTDDITPKNDKGTILGRIMESVRRFIT